MNYRVKQPLNGLRLVTYHITLHSLLVRVNVPSLDSISDYKA